jgi:glucose/arabinose dehydrogenase
MQPKFRKSLSAILLISLAALAFAQAPGSKTPQPVPLDARVQEIATGLEHPWGQAILPDGRLLVTERPGRLRILDAAGLLSEPLTGVPKVFTQGQGGLLDVAIDPRFEENQLVYISFAEPGDDGTAGTAVARGRLSEQSLDDVRVIYRQEPKVRGDKHFGSRIVFGRDGTLFITQGERFDYSEQAQDLNSLLGKIVRIHPDGSIPQDNPFVRRKDARPEIWSYGHRNVQAAAIDPETGDLWIIDHGARGGDELNRVEAGKNYGWPVIAYGVHYDGAKIGEGTAKPTLEQPLFYWDPVIAASGLTFYKSKAIPDWKGSILIGSLSPGGLVRLMLEGNRVAKEERYEGDIDDRVRDVEQAPDGSLYLLTDQENGRILRVQPIQKHTQR